MNIKEEIQAVGLPEHVAIIMDGNGRWAEKRGIDRIYGHKQGVDTVKKIVEASGEIGLKYLTLYTFSIENWNRPKVEVEALMGLMVDAIVRESSDLMRQNVRVKVIGHTVDLPERVWQKMEGLVKQTAGNTGVTLILALSYSARWEILEAAKKLAIDYKSGKIAKIEEVMDNAFSCYLTTNGIPDPDLLVRTSGECRLSNFLLWQCAYTEFYFIDKFWPDFEKDDLYLAIRNFQTRERRFGKTGKQIKAENEK
ncbi:MAG: isoprenyl transferase [Odoribacter sp.]